MYESFQEGDPLSIFEAYDSPLDSLQITRSALPDIPKAERKTIYPLEIIGAYLTLVQRKEISPPPTLALKFDSTPYQYWATDIAEDEPQRASYADWRLERHEDIRVIAVNRKPEELARIYITFFLQS